MAEIIGKSALSYNDIVTYTSQYINNAGYQRFMNSAFPAGTGETIAELVAGLGTYLSYSAMGSRKESFLSTAKNKTSIYQMANLRGLNVNRPEAPTFTIVLDKGAVQPVEFTKLTDIDNNSVYPVKKLSETEWVCKIGRVERLNVTSVMDAKDYYTFNLSPSQVSGERQWYFSNDITDHLISVSGEEVELTDDPAVFMYHGTVTEKRSTLNYVPVADLKKAVNAIKDTRITVEDAIAMVEGLAEITTTISEVVNNKVLLKTTYGGVDVIFGGNSSNATTVGNTVFGKVLKNGDTINCRFFTTQGRIGLSLDSIKSALVGSSLGIVDVKDYTDGGVEEDINKLRTVIPAFRDTQNRVVTEADYAAMTMKLRSDIYSACCIKDMLACCSADIAYLRGYFDSNGFFVQHSTDDISNDALNRTLKEQIRPLTLVGTGCTWTPAHATKINFEVTIVTQKTVSQEPILTDVKDYIKSKLYIVGGTFCIGDLYQYISSIDGVTSVHIKTPKHDYICSKNEYLTAGSYEDNTLSKITAVTSGAALITKESEEYSYINPTIHFDKEETEITIKELTSYLDTSSDIQEPQGLDVLLSDCNSVEVDDIGLEIYECNQFFDVLNATPYRNYSRITTGSIETSGETSGFQDINAKIVRFYTNGYLKTYLRLYGQVTEQTTRRTHYFLVRLFTMEEDGSFKYSTPQKLTIDVI